MCTISQAKLILRTSTLALATPPVISKVIVRGRHHGSKHSEFLHRGYQRPHLRQIYVGSWHQWRKDEGTGGLTNTNTMSPTYKEFQSCSGQRRIRSMWRWGSVDWIGRRIEDERTPWMAGEARHLHWWKQCDTTHNHLCGKRMNMNAHSSHAGHMLLMNKEKLLLASLRILQCFLNMSLIRSFTCQLMPCHGSVSGLQMSRS